MVKKKLLVGLSSLLGAAAFASLISIGYVSNNYSNSPYQYSSTPVSSSNTDLIQSYFSAAVGGSRLLYLASYTHTTPLTTGLNITKSSNEALNKYLGKTGFVLIDDQFGLPTYDDKTNLFSLSANQPIWSTNVASVQFRADLGSFITGVALGEFLNEYQSYFLDDGKLTWSTYGGLPYASVVSFMGGLQKGIEWFNENIVPKKSDYKEVEQVFLGSNDSQNFCGSFDASAGNSIINELLAKNVDVIFPVAGPQISQAARLIRQSSKKTIIIGVDSAVEEDSSINLNLPVVPSNQTIGYNNKIVQFSSIKDIQNITNKITQIINNPDIASSAENSSEWVEIGGLGYSSLGTVKNSGVGVSDAGKPYFIKAMNIYNNSNSDVEITDDNLDTLYKQATSSIVSLQAFIDLDDDENKVYTISSSKSVSYSDITNSGYEMIPISGTSSEIEAWYDTQYANNSTMLGLKTENLELINQWIEKYKDTIEERSKVKDSFVGEANNLNKAAWEKYHGVIKIMFQSPTNILFDSSFIESCYYGLRDYWATQGVELPLPYKSTK